MDVLNFILSAIVLAILFFAVVGVGESWEHYKYNKWYDKYGRKLKEETDENWDKIYKELGELRAKK